MRGNAIIEQKIRRIPPESFDRIRHFAYKMSFFVYLFLNEALFLRVGSRIFLRMRRLSGVTSKSSSVSMKSSACSRLMILGGVSLSASSALEERVLVSFFVSVSYTHLDVYKRQEYKHDNH